MQSRFIRSSLVLAGLGLACWSGATRPARADDGIFPAAPAVKKFIDFDGRGFMINGQRTFIVSGSLHYSRVPRALWHDRLMRMKRAGFNTVQTYAFWNFHEPQEGKWDFTGDHDFNAFLQEVKAVGMYAVIRPGPYVCAEWDSGGYPVWLRFKPGVRVREDNPQFEAAVDHWYEKIMPIIAANQIQRGGPVIMVQLENEHPQGWGRDMPNGYFRHLRDTALRLGLEVPYFFSGLHHGSDPGGDKPWDSKGRENPWYSTEFWPGWYNLYGPLNANDLRRFDRGTWKIIAYGGNGYNYYMLHGGTDFDTWNDDEVASSYDYGGAIGQAGDLRPIYYRFKRAALFARSFQSILEDSDNATDDYKDAATGQGIRVTARRSPAGNILFLDNNSNTGVSTQVKVAGVTYPNAGSLTIAAGEIVPIVTSYKLLPDVTLDMAASRILGISEQGNITTIVFYGQPDSTGEAHFSVPATKTVTTQGGQQITRPYLTLVTFNLRFPETGQTQNSFTVGNHQVRLLSVSDATADHTWFIETGGQNYVICGPDYVGDITQVGGQPRFTAERAAPRITVSETAAMQQLAPPEADPATTQDTIYTGTGSAVPLIPAPRNKLTGALPFYGSLLNTTGWQIRRSDAEAQPNYKDGAWKASDAPLAMGADGDTSAYAWYRTTIHAPHAGTYALNFSDVGDWVTVFINGQSVGETKIQQRFKNAVARKLTVTLQAGDNTLAVLAAHYGRHKLFGYLGAIDTIDQKGVNGIVTFSPITTNAVADAAAPVAPTINWRWKADDRGDAAVAEVSAPALDTTGADWHQATPPGEDVFHNRKGFVWYRATLGTVPGPHRNLHFESVDDNATVYLNGQKLTRHEGWDEPFEVALDAAWHENGTNILTVLVENDAGPGGIRGAVELQSGAANTGDVIHGWKLRGGLGELDPAKAGAWQRFNAVPPAQGYGEQSAAPHVPAFYRTEFVLPATPNTELGLHLIQRVTLDGMSRGFVWLNGHNLGRYPEKVPVKGLYLPEPWLLPGRNSLVIFDEEGNAPTQVHVAVEQAASRLVVDLEPRAKLGGR